MPEPSSGIQTQTEVIETNGTADRQSMSAEDASRPIDQLAEDLARSHSVGPLPGRPVPLPAMTGKYQELLEEAYAYFQGASDQELALSYAAEWFLDNEYILHQALRQIGEDLPWSYYHQLPKLVEGPLAGMPRVYALARKLFEHSRAQLNHEDIIQFVRSYQSVTPLTMGEVWAVPIMLRFVILQAMALSAGRLTQTLPDPPDPDVLLMDLQPQVEDDTVIANGFISLRVLSAEDWKEFFEQVSVVEELLSQDPASLYTGMDFETRDRYRKQVEKLSFATGLDEQEVARAALSLAEQAWEAVTRAETSPRTGLQNRSSGWMDAAQPRTAHVGYYLLGQGQRELEDRINFRAAGLVAVRRWLRAHPALFFVGSILGIAILLVAALGLYTTAAGGTAIQVVAAGLLSLIPALTIGVSVVSWLVTKLTPPFVLSKMDFREGIPVGCATLVAIPTLLGSEEEVDSLLQQLELHYLRNSDPRLAFALVTDFTDAPQPEIPGDDELVARAKAGIRHLNDKYASQAGRFYLLHRKRLWNRAEGVWMGWERKRGKLHELNLLLQGIQDTSFVELEGELSNLNTIRYVITLDSDTILPRGSAGRLIGTLAHPLNQPVFDSKTGRLISGYTILQPRTMVSPISVNKSLFTRIFTGDTGLDLYTQAVSDVYQDLFGEGIFVGKGIYDVAAFERSLEGRVPENTLLSHDLFEGIHGRTGLVTDILLIEDFPAHYLSYVKRMSRWVRGDWQIIRWLGSRVPDKDGKKVANRLAFIDRWKILDNLRRSLVSPTLLLLLAAGWLWLPGSPLVWTVVALAALGAPLLTLLAESAARILGSLLASGAAPVRSSSNARDSASPASRLRISVPNLAGTALRWLLAVAFLPFEAGVEVYAIVITLWRVFVSHRHRLSWTSFAESSRRLGERLNPQDTRREMALVWVLSLLLLALVWLLNPAALLVAGPILLMWLLSPEIAYWVSLPTEAEPVELEADQVRKLRRLARRTWLFFEQYLGPEDHWLPPDHFQEMPLGVVAHRTSPTNIGLALLANLAAYDLGYIGLLDLASRLRAMFENLDQLERHQGHFLNWYDTRTLEPLPPRYVSTVDSGNLAASLLALGQGCADMSQAQVFRWEFWQGLLDTLDLLSELTTSLAVESGPPEGARTGDGRPEIARLLKSRPVDGRQAEIRQVAEDLILQIERIREAVLSAEDTPESWLDLLVRLAGQGTGDALGRWELDRHLMGLVEVGSGVFGPEILHRMRIYAQRVHLQIENADREVEVLLPWLLMIRQPPGLLTLPATPPSVREAWEALLAALPVDVRLSQLSGIQKTAQPPLAGLRAAVEACGEGCPRAEEALTWIDELDKKLQDSAMSAKVLLIGYEDLQRQSEALAMSMNFKFLFSTERNVFHIGYNLALNRLDNSYYDLLASEARIASLFAIAKGDVPQRHWLHLGRPLTQVDDTQALLSWSATMFEYLMPVLLLRSYPNTLLHQSALAATDHQIAYGKENKVPWGISESGYYRLDSNQVYQYRAFGVPGLGYKRGLAEDLVIAPYASLLALPLRPEAVLQNIDHLAEIQGHGMYGLYEAIDFTPSRLPLGMKYAVVQEYMAHHQGMIFLSLNNFFRDNIMVQRFHRDARIQTVDLLLQEKIPQTAPYEHPHAVDGRANRPPEPQIAIHPWRVRVNASQPRLHFLSNGRYGVLLTNSGGGYSAWKDVDLTRWQPDSSLQSWGTWIYFQDLESGDFWSVGHQPTAVAPRSRDVLFNAHMAEFRRRDGEITTVMELTVPPEDDLEIRRITLTNESSQVRRLRVVSYGEVILTSQANDQRHPAFNKLFIQSEWDPDVQALIFRRRPRSETESPLYFAHSLVVENGQAFGAPAWEGDRMRFLGRGQTVRAPEVLVTGSDLSGTVGSTLDPIFSISQTVEVPPQSTVRLAFLSLAGSSHHEVVERAGRYRDGPALERAFTQARLQAEVELRQLGGLSSSQLQRAERLLSALLFPDATLRASPETLARNEQGQPALWAYGISGDYPILLVRIHELEELTLVQELLQAHAYWRNRQLKIDLVLLNEQGTDYGQELTGQIFRLLQRMNADTWLNRRGGIFIVPADRLSSEDRVLLESAARVVLDSDQGSLAEQLHTGSRLPPRLPYLAPPSADVIQASREQARDVPGLEPPTGLQFFNGLGGFSPDGREYVIYLAPGQWTPAPWINVIANPDFGFLVSEAGSSYTWSLNSGENRLTPWTNDPVSDRPGEALYLRDEETIDIWSPTPLPARSDQPYRIRHGAGYSIFEHSSHGLRQEVCLFAASDAPVKFIRLRLENPQNRVRHLTATYYAEWVLGVNRTLSQQYILPEYDGDTQALLARNPYQTEFGERVAFLAASQPVDGVTTDRTEFLGRMGNIQHPAALGRIGLSGNVRPGLDPCAALQLRVDLEPGQVKEVYFLLGQGADREAVLELVRRYQSSDQMEAAWEAVGGFWDGLLDTVQVQTPEPAMDLVLNRWLLYQALSCRIWGRSAFYQSSGAYGFRDQLQDVLSTLYSDPQIAREQILRAARHQFDAGDVLHWWHPPSGRGVRTRISDDLLWLPFVTAQYVETTGDEAILDEQIPFLKGPPLKPDEEERYGSYPSTTETFSLFEHCRRVIEKGATGGPHQLPLMGTGDWNDGMNRVGAEGRGESVWLGWFLYDTLTRFARLCERRGEQSQASAYREWAANLAQALEESAWDGDWYLRAFYDDGSPLGSKQNRECQIDAIAQSWAVLSEAGDPARARQAMQSVLERLVRPEERLILLFTPPFDKTSRDPGYIKGYVPGIRENGGQYTHAAIWTVWAFSRLGLGDLAGELFQLLNPILHSDSPEKTERYKVEPYVVAADVYSVPPHTGRGGWTWYTGSSGWLYRLGLEAILGLRLEQGRFLRLDPCIPAQWPGFSMNYRFGESLYHIEVKNPDGVSQGVRRVTVDGSEIPGDRIELKESGSTHQVLILLGSPK